MLDGLLSRKSDRRLVILVALILLDAFTFIVFDVYTGIQSGTNVHPFSTMADILWVFNINHIVDLLSGRYSLDYIWAGTQAFYISNGFIINKVAIILISGIVVVCIYRYAPDLLFICYGYLLGVAGVGIYDGLMNTGVISSEGLTTLPFDFKIIPQAIMGICVVTGGIISLSKVAAYIFSQMIALHLFDREEYGFFELRVPFIDRLLNKTRVYGTQEDHKLRIPQEFLPIYEKNIKELADLDTQNSIEAIQRSYDLVNQMAEKYGVDQYHVMYDVYKEKKGRAIERDTFSNSKVYDNAFDKGL
jgi:hypothetical protein